MLEELAGLPEVQGLTVEVLDVDADPGARGRYGLKVPVLLIAGEFVCHGRLDREELRKSLAYHR